MLSQQPCSDFEAYLEGAEPLRSTCAVPRWMVWKSAVGVVGVVAVAVVVVVVVVVVVIG